MQPRVAMKSLVLSLAGLVGFAAVEVGAFVPGASSAPSTRTPAPIRRRHRATTALPSSTSGANDVDVVGSGWTPLTDDGGVKMSVVSSPPDADAADLPSPVPGRDDVTVEYVGSIVPRNWTAEDVVACWLPDRGLSKLAPELFRAFEIDGAKLANAKKFNRKFIFEGLGVLKEAKIDALLSAAEDLKASEGTHPEGTVFDKNRFAFRLGKGMSIPAFELAVGEMKVGQTASLVARCDYAYGRQGLRGAGNFLVPPYATVQYDLTLVEIK